MNTNEQPDESFIGGDDRYEQVVCEGHEGIEEQQDCRNILVSLAVEGGPAVFVSIRVHSWFVFIRRSTVFCRNDQPDMAAAGFVRRTGWKGSKSGLRQDVFHQKIVFHPDGFPQDRGMGRLPPG